MSKRRPPNSDRSSAGSEPGASRPAGGRTRSGGAVRSGGGPAAKPSARGARARLAEQQAAAERSRRRRKTIIGVAIGLGVAVIIGAVITAALSFGGRPSGTMAEYAAAVDRAQVPPANGGPVSFGPDDAPHTMELFVDFRCPHCAEFEREYGEVIARAEAEGRVRTEVHPLVVIDQSSAAAANAFACAAEAGYPRSYFNGLFASPSTAWDSDSLVDLATTVGQDPSPAFQNCVVNNQYGAWVQSQATLATEKNVTGTPTVFVDGELVPVETLSEQRLNELLG